MNNTILESKTDYTDYITPPEVVMSINEVLVPNITLDPASSKIANNVIQALNYFTIEDDGLTKPWFGNVFCNPPYNGHTSPWAHKFIEEWQSGRIAQGLFLVNANFGYQWFNELLYDQDLPVCIFKERLYFLPEDGQPSGQARRASAMFYFGDSYNSFDAAFSKWGKIIW